MTNSEVNKMVSEVTKREKLLGIILAFEFPLHSIGVFNPSVFTVRKFGLEEKNPEDIRALKEGQIGSLILNLFFTLAMYITYKRKAPIIPTIAGLTSISIFLYYWGIIEGKW